MAPEHFGLVKYWYESALDPMDVLLDGLECVNVCSQESEAVKAGDVNPCVEVDKRALELATSSESDVQILHVAYANPIITAAGRKVELRIQPLF